MISYSLIRTRRKTVAIHITSKAEVEVRAPMKTPVADIERFLIKKEKWIKKHIAFRETLINKKSAFNMNYGNTALFRGITYPINAVDGERPGFDGNRFSIPSGLTLDGIKQTMVRIYKIAARSVFSAKINKYAGNMNVKPTAVRISSAKTRWGSCSVKNSINLSWRLIMADDELIDYVIVHELAHIREHNHSPHFWAVVENIMPDYSARQKKLKQFQRKLAGESWD